MTLCDSSQHQRGVLTAEGDTVGDGMLDFSLATGMRDVVEIARRVRRVEIDGGRKLPGLHGKDCCSNSGGAAGSLRMADLGLQGGHGNAMSTLIAESKL